MAKKHVSKPVGFTVNTKGPRDISKKKKRKKKAPKSGVQGVPINPATKLRIQNKQRTNEARTSGAALTFGIKPLTPDSITYSESTEPAAQPAPIPEVLRPKMNKLPQDKKSSLTAAQASVFKAWAARQGNRISRLSIDAQIELFHKEQRLNRTAAVKETDAFVKPEPEDVKLETENTMNHLPQNAKHTLQLIRMPSEEVIDLGRVSYEAWLTHNHYDPTNLVSQRTAWAYSDGWHIKRCVNTITGEEDFWLISFNGQGGEPISIKSQYDYRSAYRYLAARGYHPTTLEGMDRNTLYKTYKSELRTDAPEQASKLKAKRKPIRSVPLRTPEQQEERRERANRLRQLRRVAVRKGQGRFRLQVLGNYGGICCITGLVDNIEAAHIVPHCDTANQHPANGLPLAKFLHGAFDTGLISVNPETLRVEVAPAARAWLSIDGIQISDGQIWPIDRVALAAHHALFTVSCGA